MARQRILLVEDNEDNRIVYTTVLLHFGYDVVSARNGEEGIRSARETIPDLILMDISLPVVNGWEATGVLKADPRTAHIPIIALTAHAMREDRERAYALGCDGFLTKPIEPRRVVKEIERILGADRMLAG